MTSLTHDISDETIDEKVNRERINLLFFSARKSNLFVITGSVVISFAFWPAVSVFPLEVWAGVMILLACIRLFVCCYLYKKQIRVARLRKRNEFFYVTVTAMMGVAWGCLALLPHVYDSVYSQSVLFLTMVATLFIAHILLAMHKVAQLVYMVPFPLILVYSLIVKHHPWAIQFSSLVMLFLIYMLWLGKQSHASLVKALVLHFTNESLIEKLEVSIENEKNANRAKRDFLANMSHEIRTPMTGIVGMTQLVLDTELSVEQEKLLQNVKISSDSLLRLLNDILDFSKIEAGQLVMEENVFSLPAMLNHIGSMYHFTAKEKGLDLFLPDDTSTLPEFISGDELRLRQVLTNLITNGLKFTPSGSVTVTVDSRQRSENSVELHFIIIDTGIGIPPDKRELIFSSFSQADSSIARQFGGSGLGLAICKQLVEMMGGRIWFEEREQQGTQFHFTVVFGLASRQEGLELVGDVVEGMVLNILLVDDNRVNQDLAVLFLKRCGHSVTVAVNGLEALKLLAVQDNFDLIFMDVQMPVMDGLTASNYIRMSEENKGFDSSSLPPDLPQKLVAQRYKKHIPIVAMTANAMSGDRQKCLDAGMDEYLTKPFQQDQILRIIASVFGNSSFAVAGVTELTQSQQKTLAVKKQDVRNIVCEHLNNIYGLEVEETNEFLRTSCISLSDNLDKALACDEQGDLAALSAAAHSLKGSLLNLGLNDLAVQAKEIELKCKKGEKNLYGKQLKTIQDNLSVMLIDCLQQTGSEM